MADPGPSGLLLVDKPSGITSHDAVDRVRRVLEVRKVGHSGTLDPMATGLLVIGVGRATRLLRFLGEFPKVYEGSGMLGIETTTLDAEGGLVRETPVAVSEDALRRAIESLRGDIEQSPPAYSAVKVRGERAYRVARRGDVVDAEPRQVHIHEFELRAFESPRFEFFVKCSGGTYVRSLVSDVGRAVGSGAHLTSLRRTGLGPFRVQDAHPPDSPGPLLPIDRAVEHLVGVKLEEEEARVAAHGSILGPAGIAGPYRVLAPDGTLIGIYRDEGGKAVPEVILAPA